MGSIDISMGVAVMYLIGMDMDPCPMNRSTKVGFELVLIAQISNILSREIFLESMGPKKVTIFPCIKTSLIYYMNQPSVLILMLCHATKLPYSKFPIIGSFYMIFAINNKVARIKYVRTCMSKKATNSLDSRDSATIN